ncbi:FAD-binding domain-containing protein [Stipitochalara longipes BDJ]|nr:FAD-binding domain-containing protein [Stipitochalara longipes BDJ]
MASLSSSILAVLERQPPPSISTYRQIILDNAGILNNLWSSCDRASGKEKLVAATKAFGILFKERAVIPEMPSYENELQKNWSSTAWLPAACFVKTQNTQEVALALKIVTLFQTPFAIRAGGHSANPGFASVESGILIDLSSLNDIFLSPDHEVVSVGPGAKWGTVYEELEKHELTVVGGRVADVGVGGLITGGGMSHFSNFWGLACDQVKEFEVVLADSSIVCANANENSDLFRVLKGGGTNFGIVTRFDLFTQPEYRVWSTLKAYNPADVVQVMNATISIQTAMDQDDKIGLFVSALKDMFVVGCLYRGWDVPPKTFEAFDAITEVAILMPETKGTQKSLARALNIAGSTKRAVGVVSVMMDLGLYVELHEVLKNIDISALSSLAFHFQPFGASASGKGEERGGNSLGIVPVSQAWLGIMGEWKDDMNDEQAVAQTHQLISSIETAARARGLLLDFKFMNDASYTQFPFTATTLKSLKAASEKWDPEGVFQRLQNSGFLISKGGAS